MEGYAKCSTHVHKVVQLKCTRLHSGLVKRLKQAVVGNGRAAVVALLAPVRLVVLQSLRRGALQAGQVR